MQKSNFAEKKIENADQGGQRTRRRHLTGAVKSLSTSKKVNTLQSRLKKAKDHKSSTERDLKDIENEAHRKGIPPGWLRCQFD